MIETVRRPEVIRPELVTAIQAWTPRSGLGWSILRVLELPQLPEDLRAELFERIRRAVVCESELRLRVLRGLGLAQQGLIPWAEIVVEDYGVVSRRVVTDTGVGFIVDAFQNLVELENMKYHGIGTGVGGELASNTALGTELTTEYNPNSTRATGTTAETAANVFQSVGTNTLDSGTPAITEHMLLSQAATGGGVGLDRSVFSAINLVGANGDGLQSDYRLTLTSGG